MPGPRQGHAGTVALRNTDIAGANRRFQRTRAKRDFEPGKCHSPLPGPKRPKPRPGSARGPSRAGFVDRNLLFHTALDSGVQAGTGGPASTCAMALLSRRKGPTLSVPTDPVRATTILRRWSSGTLLKCSKKKWLLTHHLLWEGPAREPGHSRRQCTEGAPRSHGTEATVPTSGQPAEGIRDAEGDHHGTAGVTGTAYSCGPAPPRDSAHSMSCIS